VTLFEVNDIDIYLLRVMSDMIRHPVSEPSKKALDSLSTLLRVVSPSTLLRTVSLSNGLPNHGSSPE
jgi:hypothetical protein